MLNGFPLELVVHAALCPYQPESWLEQVFLVAGLAALC
jgi:hypothetical protein